ncbi:hypothetical protein AB6Q13_21270 [Ralstonia solanacearum]|uniref:hypothetical protein n=1 Tax=Ralstonia solanacearum TaxID=305 RepID=UPI001FF91CCF|nr:hypothetical protein [Ralstonia solanacearum]MDB0568782.1 hypothetical protein [Ralstonia solanacearum]MDB0578537.1 hypothetical protein [Ralstonia solanacearum]
MSEEILVKLIVDTFGVPEKPQQLDIPKASLLDWMRTDDVEVLGAIYAFISKPEYAKRVQPALTLQEYGDFILRYFDCCIRLNPSGEWAHTRYEAGWDLAAWFARLWREGDASRKTLEKIKAWLANLYKEADEEIRRCIVDATLEHLLENREITQFFSDWKGDVDLSIAYAEAAAWAKKSRGTRGKPDGTLL